MNPRSWLLGPVLAGSLVGCGREARPAQSPNETETRTAEVELEAADGTEIEGEATLEEAFGSVRVTLKVEDAPSGPIGVHIHEKGDCSDIRGKSMGGHFSPEDTQHALPEEREEKQRHLGDLGNIQVDEDGEGTLEFVIHNASLRKDDSNSLLGRALVVHEAEDKGKAMQPSGGSGEPIACGVIEAS